MKQLKLSQQQLIAIGFTKKEWDAIEPTEDNPYGSSAKTTWEIPTINGCFYCNNSEETYVWYHKTIIGSDANFVSLDITHKANLFTVLSAFRARFNLVILDSVV